MNQIKILRKNIADFFKARDENLGPDHVINISENTAIQLVPDATPLSKSDETCGIVIVHRIGRDLNKRGFSNDRLELTDAEAVDLWRSLEMLYTDDGK